MSDLTINEAFVPVKEIDEGGQGVPVPRYHLRFKGETLRVVTRAAEAREWLAHPYHQGFHYSCISVIDGVEREVQRNR
jgi:hypothetical protein